MTILAKLLDDVLTGRRVVRSASTFNLLRRVAPQKACELDQLEAHAAACKNTRVETPVCRPDPIYLTRADLEEIILQRRSATLDELEWLLEHGSERHLLLSTTEEMTLRHLAARMLASQHIAEARALDHNEEFIGRVLGIVRTKYGDLSQAEVANLEAIRLQAARAIEDCKDHRKQRCSCWKSAREALFALRLKTGEGSPVSMGALAVWNSIEALARDRPKGIPIAEQDDGPPGYVYNWRYYKCPEYFQSMIGESL